METINVINEAINDQFFAALEFLIKKPANPQVNGININKTGIM